MLHPFMAEGNRQFVHHITQQLLAAFPLQLHARALAYIFSCEMSSLFSTYCFRSRNIIKELSENKNNVYTGTCERQQQHRRACSGSCDLFSTAVCTTRQKGYLQQRVVVSYIWGDALGRRGDSTTQISTRASYMPYLWSYNGYQSRDSASSPEETIKSAVYVRCNDAMGSRPSPAAAWQRPTHAQTERDPHLRRSV
jgi:hypothetical protein